MPDILYQRLQRLSILTRCTLESVLLKTLNAHVPFLPDNLPANMREMLIELEKLNDESLWNIARSMLSQEQYNLLLEKKRQGTLTASEQIQLEKLYNDANEHMLRKAYANVLLKWRGYKLPTLAELSS
jgi:RNase adaptor protein for sRNA GlmZ degradation